MVEVVKLYQAEYIDVGSLRRDPTSKVASQGIRNGSNSLASQLAC